MTKNSYSARVLSQLEAATGIDLKGTKLRMRFTYRGVACQEVLQGVKVDSQGIKYASRWRETVLHEIATGKFDYRKHFPESPRAEKFDHQKIEQRTVDKGVELWLKAQKVKKAKSTYRNYKSKSKKPEAKFSGRLIASVSKAEMEAYQAELIETGLSTKTVNDIFTIIRGVWHDAHVDGIVERNIMEAIKNFDTSERESDAFPFTKSEQARIAKVKTPNKSEVNMMLFDCWVGLSASELIAVAWEDIDLERWTVRVQRAYVDGEWKVPKEKARARTVEIIHPARPWLARQVAISANLPPVEIEVRQRDNITLKAETIRPVFINTRTGRHHSGENNVNRDFVKPILRSAKVPYRGLNQCRHTFASQMLSHYVSKDWIINQMGHTSYDMLYRHYAKFIPKDTPLLAGIVTQQLGLDGDKFDSESVPFLSQVSLKRVK